MGHAGSVTILLVQGALSLVVRILGPYYVTMFTSDPDVLSQIRDSITHVCVFVLMDGIQNVGGGILRGAGKQNLGAGLNFIAFYVIGLPMSYQICFHWGFGVSGLILGMSCANAIQAVVQQSLLIGWPDLLFGDTGAWLQYHREPRRNQYTAIPEVEIELATDGDGNTTADL